MQNAFLQPALDADGVAVVVRDPETLIPLPEEGEWKALTGYWLRRLRDRDVVDATPSASVTASDAPAPAD